MHLQPTVSIFLFSILIILTLIILFISGSSIHSLQNSDNLAGEIRDKQIKFNYAKTIMSIACLFISGFLLYITAKTNSSTIQRMNTPPRVQSQYTTSPSSGYVKYDEPDDDDVTTTNHDIVGTKRFPTHPPLSGSGRAVYN